MIEKSKVPQILLNEARNHNLTKSKKRQKELGEVFTPVELVYEILQRLSKESKCAIWKEGKTFLDPSCGNGQFLAAIAIQKKGMRHKKILETIYGVDIMQDNVDECRERLLKIVGNTPKNRAIVENNIVCADGLTYSYQFGKLEQQEFPFKSIMKKLKRVKKVKN